MATANEHLDYIRDKALRELAPGWLRQRVLSAVEACRIGHCNFSGIPPVDHLYHCGKVIAARIEADHGNWGQCANELEHGE